MANLPERGVATKTKTTATVAVTVGALLLLGLAAYGFGFMIAGPNKGTSLTGGVQTPPAKTTGGVQSGETYTASPSICNQDETSKGGAGRCYPTCREKGDCLKAGYVSEFADCAAKSIAICGDSKECVRLVCGIETPDCVQGFCTRPNLALTRSQCPASAPQFAAIPLASADRCGIEAGKCYKGCTADTDCIDSSKYDACVASTAVKAACTKPLTGAVDAACIKTQCGTKPVAVVGSCLKDSSGQASYCSKSLPDIGKRDDCVIKVAINDVLTVETGERVWVSSCVKSKAICTSDADCSAPVTGTIAVMGPACDLATGSCFRRCESDLGCTPGYDKYVTCASDKKNVEACTRPATFGAGALDQTCLKQKCGNAPTVTAGSCLPAQGGIPAHCTAAVPKVTSKTACTPIVALDSQQNLQSGKNVWVGTCPDKKTACMTSTECKPATPVLPSFGKWVGVCPSAIVPGVANCTTTGLTACTQPSGTPGQSACDFTNGLCERQCESDDACRPEMKACVEAVSEYCQLIDSPYDDCMKARTAKCEALGVCPKPSSTGGKSYCPSILAATNQTACQGSGGTWLGKCGSDASKRCSTDSECLTQPTGTAVLPQGEKTCAAEASKCFRPCANDAGCTSDSAACLKDLTAKCTVGGKVDDACKTAGTAACNALAKCTQTGSLPGLCGKTIPTTTETQCKNAGGLWLGTCGDKPSAACRVATDC